MIKHRNAVAEKAQNPRVPKGLSRLLLKGFTAIALSCAPGIAQNAQNDEGGQNTQGTQNAQSTQNSQGTQNGQGTQGASAPDNSKRNAADQPTAEDQGHSPQDREMTRNIRRGLVANDSLSTTAKNIKVITENGKVTLRGPVASEEERRTIAALVEQIAGKGNVTNQLEPKER